MHPTDKEAAREALLGLTARVVEAYLGKNQLAASKLGDVIRTVHGSLAKVQEETNGPQSREPAVPVKASVTPDYLVCLEDGRKVKMLRRYLRKAYRMSPIEYRTRWGLPADYPMVAPNYAKTRSLLAKRIGLGHHPRKVTN